ncbi:SDR family oxidoreductase [soil metagenome]
MPSTCLCIITGASRGMGAAIAEQLHRTGATLLCISRGTNESLDAEQWTMDLSEPAPVAERLAHWLGAIDAEEFDSAVLINNAAIISNIAPLEACDPLELARGLRVGLEAPMLLTAAFLRSTLGWRARRDRGCKVLNISSGLGRRAMASAAGYCAVKAGLDLFSSAVALDQAASAHPAGIVSLAPGVIDTDMQIHLRAADPSLFPDHQRFIGLKASNALDSPAAAAAKVIAYLGRADFGTKVIADLRDA